jgi:hypothetical protein
MSTSHIRARHTCQHICDVTHTSTSHILARHRHSPTLPAPITHHIHPQMGQDTPPPLRCSVVVICSLHVVTCTARDKGAAAAAAAATHWHPQGTQVTWQGMSLMQHNTPTRFTAVGETKPIRWRMQQLQVRPLSSSKWQNYTTTHSMPVPRAATVAA